MGLFPRTKAEALNEPVDTRDGLDTMRDLAEQARISSERPRTSFSDEPDAYEPVAPDEDEAVEAVDQQADRPDWMLDNFATVEQQAQAYQHAQVAFTKAAQERAELRNYVDALASQLEAQQQPALVQPGVVDPQNLSAIAERVSQVQAAFQPQVAPDSPEWDAAVSERLGAVAPWWSEDTGTKVQALLDQQPNILTEASYGSPQAMALSLAELGKIVQQREAVEQAQFLQRQNKAQSQTLSGQSGRPAPKDSWEDRWDEISNAGFSARDVLNPR